MPKFKKAIDLLLQGVKAVSDKQDVYSGKTKGTTTVSTRYRSLKNATFSVMNKEFAVAKSAMAVGAVMNVPADPNATTYIKVYSGAVSPISNDLKVSGGSGIISSWMRWQLPGKPIGVKVHIASQRLVGDAVIPHYRALVGATSQTAVDTVAHTYYPDGGNVVSATGWHNVLFGGVDGADAPLANITGMTNTGSCRGEVVSDTILLPNITMQADGTSHICLAVEQNAASGGYTTWMGIYPQATNAAPKLFALNNTDPATDDSYWLDYWSTALVNKLAVTNVGTDVPTALQTSSTVASSFAWLEPVYDTPIRSFLSTGDSTHSCANGYQTFDGWIGRAVRALSTGAKPVTYQHAGGSGHSFTEFMNIFDDMNSHSDYSDLILQGWSQNGFVATSAGAQAYIDAITTRVTAAKAKKQRVFITTGYGVPGYTGANVYRAQVITGIKALHDGKNVFVVDTDALITDYSVTPFGGSGAQTIQAAYYDGTVHINLAGQLVLIQALRAAIQATM